MKNKDKYANVRCPCKNELVDQCTCKHCKISVTEEKQLKAWLQEEFKKR